MAKNLGQNRNVRLSKNLSQMKFMQRRQQKDIEEELESERRRLIDDTHWVLDLPDLISKGNRYNTVDSISDCEDLAFGRMSFKGMNPIIEKIMQNLEAEDESETEEEEKAVQVTDKEMAERYTTLMGTIEKKFTKKRNRSRTEELPSKKQKKSFLKPPDE